MKFNLFNKKKCVPKENVHTPENVSVAIDDFLSQYLSAIPYELFVRLSKQALKGEQYATIPACTYNEVVKKRKEMEEADNKLSRIAEINNKGIEAEKSGEIEAAIKLYEENIYSESCEALHPFERLMIIYHKHKDFGNEARIIRKAIQVFGEKNERIAELAIKNNPEQEAEIREALQTCINVRGNQRNSNGVQTICFAPYPVVKFKERLSKLEQKYELQVTTTYRIQDRREAD